MIGRCRSCDAQVNWVRTKRGKNMPLDPIPDPESGNVVVRREQEPVEVFRDAASARAWLLTHEGRGPFTSHFATCKFAGRHRRQRQPAPRPVAIAARRVVDPQRRLL